MRFTVQKSEYELTIDQLLVECVEKKGSDLHLVVGMPPCIRINGDLVQVDAPPLKQGDMEYMILSILKDYQRERLEQDWELDFSYAIAGCARFRGNVMIQRGTLAAVFRVVPFVIPEFDKLGLPQDIKRLCDLPRGLVLVTGPTGSGKSTTLAAMIDMINNTRACNIVTVEDPIEFLHKHKKSTVRQRELGTDTHSFASALRHVLRHDPDIIMIGEMRDRETCEMAIQAALTGHLVFSTLHTNDSASAYTRLLDMGLEPYLITSTVIGILAQRLVRKICTRCREAYTPEPELLSKIGIRPGIQLYRGKGCKQCGGSGYSGRIGIFELLVPDANITKLVLQRAPFEQIKQYCLKRGDFDSLRRDGLRKAIEGLTTIEQVLGATQND